MSSVSLWNTPTGAEIALIIERSKTEILLPVATGFQDLEIEIISGQLPGGTRLEGTKIAGITFEVAVDTVFTCVFRAHANGYFDDRTFKFVVTGADAPTWTTNSGLLPVGTNNTFFILDNEIIDFQLVARDNDIPAGDVLTYFIADGDGVLPPGISLTEDGRLYGTTEALLSLDKRYQSGGYDTQPYGEFPLDYSVLSGNGYSTFFYDTQTYDYSEFTQSLRKQNRFYPFAVTVTDGNTFTRREFKIYLVGDDYLRADNTVMSASTGVFTADVTPVRTPKWITPRNLGFKRANNYTTIYLDIIDNDQLVGVVTYTLESENDDGSPSELPTGLSLDSRTGEITGKLPYQPAVTESYKFSVRATRVEGAFETVSVFANFYEDVLLGNKIFKVYKLDLTGSIDGVSDLQDLLNRQVIINRQLLTVTRVDASNDEYDIIEVNDTLAPNISLLVSRLGNYNDSILFVSRLQEHEKEKYIDSKLTFSTTESYTITNITPYIEYEIEHPNLEFTEQGLTSTFGGECYIQKIQDNIWRIQLPSTAKTRIISLIREFVTPSDGSSSVARVTLIRDNEDRLTFNTPLVRQLNQGRNIGIALFKNDFFREDIIVASEDETTRPSSVKTFELNVIGEIDSNIKWLTDSYLGSIEANYISTLRVEAETTVPDSTMVYQIVDGKLPFGMRLNHYGEIVGAANQFASSTENGLTTFDNRSITWDGKFPGATSFDRRYSFTVEARDRFGFTAITRKFVLDVLDLDSRKYTDIVARPMLKLEQRQQYKELTSNSNIFPTNKIYRADDQNFGIKDSIEMLVFAGIEAKQIDQFVAAAAKNHKKTRYRLGPIQKAIAREPGTRETIYEVIYIPVIDPAAPQSGAVRSSLTINTGKKITADSVQYSTKDDSSNRGEGLLQLPVYGREIVKFVFSENGKELIVDTRAAGSIKVNVDNSDFVVDVRDSADVSVELKLDDSEPQRLRPDTANTIKADSNAIQVSDSKDQKRYISSIANMRDNIDQIGEKQREYLPLWMRTPQEGFQELGFISAIPICYCKPGTADSIILNIKNSKFDFKKIDFVIDRYIIKQTETNNNEQFILFANYQFNV